MDDFDDTLDRVKTLIAQREAIYNALAALLHGQPSIAKHSLTCSICQSSQHTARTCPQEPQE